METISYKLKKNITEIMNDNIARDIPDIKDYLAQKKDFKYGRDYRDGHLAGVLRVLVANGTLEKVERGKYQLNRKGSLTFEERQETGNTAAGNTIQIRSEETSLEQIRKETLISLETQYNSLVSRMDAIAISALTPADFEDVKLLSELKEEVKDILVRYGRRD